MAKKIRRVEQVQENGTIYEVELEEVKRTKIDKPNVDESIRHIAKLINIGREDETHDPTGRKTALDVMRFLQEKDFLNRSVFPAQANIEDPRPQE